MGRRDPTMDPRPGDCVSTREVTGIKYSWETDDQLPYVYSVRYRTAGSSRARWVSVQEWRRWASLTRIRMTANPQPQAAPASEECRAAVEAMAAPADGGGS